MRQNWPPGCANPQTWYLSLQRMPYECPDSSFQYTNAEDVLQQVQGK